MKRNTRNLPQPKTQALIKQLEEDIAHGEIKIKKQDNRIVSIEATHRRKPLD